MSFQQWQKVRLPFQCWLVPFYLFPSKLFPTQMALSIFVLLFVGIKLVLWLECLSTAPSVTPKVSRVDPWYVPSQASEAEQLWRVANVTSMTLCSVLRFLSLCLGLFIGFRVIAVMCSDVMRQILLVRKWPLTIFAIKRLSVNVTLFMPLSQFDSVKHDAAVRAPEGFGASRQNTSQQ